MAKAETTSTTSRRLLLGGMAAISAAGALAAPVVAVDPHVGWWREHEELDRLYAAHNAEDGSDEDIKGEILVRQVDLWWLIIDTPATTEAGLLVQAKALREGITYGHYELNELGIERIIAFIERSVSGTMLQTAA